MVRKIYFLRPVRTPNQFLQFTEPCDILPVEHCSGAAGIYAVGPQQRAASCPLILRRGGCPMVTYSDLIQIGILIVGIAGLFIQAKKKWPPAPRQVRRSHRWHVRANRFRQHLLLCSVYPHLERKSSILCPAWTQKGYVKCTLTYV